jgi:hypothetical protein
LAWRRECTTESERKHESNGEAAVDTVDEERNWRSMKAGERLATDGVDELTKWGFFPRELHGR